VLRQPLFLKDVKMPEHFGQPQEKLRIRQRREQHARQGRYAHGTSLKTCQQPLRPFLLPGQAPRDQGRVIGNSCPVACQ
jgi:hypothetical protein